MLLYNILNPPYSRIGIKCGPIHNIRLYKFTRILGRFDIIRVFYTDRSSSEDVFMILGDVVPQEILECLMHLIDFIILLVIEWEEIVSVEDIQGYIFGRP